MQEKKTLLLLSSPTHIRRSTRTLATRCFNARKKRCCVMSGIVHKESLPGQGHIKRRRVDVPPAADTTEQTPAKDNSQHSGDGTEKMDGETQEQPQPTTSSPPHNTDMPPPRAASSSSSSSEDDDDDSDDEIERENARLAKLREQRNRRQQQQQQQAGTSASPSATTTSEKASAAAAQAGGSNSYDHDVLFRNAAWRNSAKPATADAKRKEKWNSVLNRTQDSAAHHHFMKKYFK